MRLTMLCLSGFELYSRWVPLFKLMHTIISSLIKQPDTKMTISPSFGVVKCRLFSWTYNRGVARGGPGVSVTPPW